MAEEDALGETSNASRSARENSVARDACSERFLSASGRTAEGERTARKRRRTGFPKGTKEGTLIKIDPMYTVKVAPELPSLPPASASESPALPERPEERREKREGREETAYRQLRTRSRAEKPSRAWRPESPDLGRSRESLGGEPPRETPPSKKG